MLHQLSSVEEGRDWDPMAWEAALSGPGARLGRSVCNPDRADDVGSMIPTTPVVGRFSGPTVSGSRPVAGSTGPVSLVEEAGVPVSLRGPAGLSDDAVRFDISPGHSTSRDDHRNVTVLRGSRDPLPLHIFDGVSSPVKGVVADFAKSLCKDPSPSVLLSTPPRRRARVPPATLISIRHSERLAKKSRHRATKPALQAQNIMMKRLGVTSPSHPPDANSYQRYVDTFSSTLSTSHAEALDALLPTGLGRAMVVATP